MVKNKGKGGKNRRRGKNDSEATKRELTYKEDGQGVPVQQLLPATTRTCIRAMLEIMFGEPCVVTV